MDPTVPKMFYLLNVADDCGASLLTLALAEDDNRLFVLNRGASPPAMYCTESNAVNRWMSLAVRQSLFFVYFFFPPFRSSDPPRYSLLLRRSAF